MPGTASVTPLSQPLTPAGLAAQKAAKDKMLAWTPPPKAQPSVGGIEGAGKVGGGHAINAAQLLAGMPGAGGAGGAGGAAGGAGGAGGGAGAGGGYPGGPVAGQFQLSPGVGNFISQQQAQIDKMKAAGADPNLQAQIDAYKKRLSTDTTGRAIDRAGSAISDAAAGAKAGQATELARRGTLGSGAGDQQMGQIDAAAERAKAGSAAGISLGREGQLDQLVLGGQGIMSAPSQYGLAQQGQLLGALGQGAGMAGSQENIAQGWAGVGNQQRQTEIAGQQAAQGQYLALMRLLMGGAYA